MKRLFTTIIGPLFLAAMLGVATFLLVYNPEPGDPPCYAVVDRVGNVYPSYYPPYPTSDAGGAIWVFNDDHQWGFVFGPSATVADRDCLRERGVDVPPLRTQEEAP